MKMKQKLVAGAAVLSALAGFTVPAAHADVAATVGASNMYYWRGFDLGGGAAVSADVNISAAGFIAGAWTSSGDATMGTEYDLYAGYSGSVGDFSYGISVVSYNYANPKGTYDHDSDEDAVTPEIPYDPVSPGEYVEVVPFLGFGPFKVTYYDAVVAEHPYFDEDYSYVTAELNFEKIGVKYGQHMLKDGGKGSFDGVSHLDATYKYNSKLSFTVGQIIDDNDMAPDETNFIVNLSLPLE